jgi:hypothetical protein
MAALPPGGSGGTVAWVENPVDPDHELAVSNAAWVRDFDLKIGAERPIGHHHRSGRYQGAVRDGLAGHRGTGMLLTLCACASTSLWMSATN